MTLLARAIQLFETEDAGGARQMLTPRLFKFKRKYGFNHLFLTLILLKMYQKHINEPKICFV